MTDDLWAQVDVSVSGQVCNSHPEAEGSLAESCEMIDKVDKQSNL